MGVASFRLLSVKHLFHDWRYLDDDGHQENPDFILNKPEYKDIFILLTRKNFGCGSSREHAPWALEEFGFRVIIAPSFADIFYGNCINIGLLPIVFPEDQVDALIKSSGSNSLSIEIDLETQTVSASGNVYSFEINEFHKHCLQQGIDSIDWTLQSESAISTYEKAIPSWR